MSDSKRVLDLTDNDSDVEVSTPKRPCLSDNDSDAEVALQFVEGQIGERCLAAVEQDGSALQCVKESDCDAEHDLCVAPRIKALLLREDPAECLAAIEHFQHYRHPEATAAVQDFADSCPRTYMELAACSKTWLIAHIMAHQLVKTKP